MSDDTQNVVPINPVLHCRLCKHAFKTGQTDSKQEPLLECRRFPPTYNLLVMPGRLQGGPPNIVKQTDFPNCGDVCGEFVTKGGD